MSLVRAEVGHDGAPSAAAWRTLRGMETLDPTRTGSAATADLPVLALSVAWSRTGWARVGEVALFPESLGPQWVGRGTGGDGVAPHAVWLRQRPGDSSATDPLASRSLSRCQLLVRPGANALNLDNRGRAALTINGGPDVGEARVEPGDVVSIAGQLVLLVTERPAVVQISEPLDADFGFGEPDTLGVVGESPTTWRLRAQLAFLGRGRGHLLLEAPHGTAAYEIARLIHELRGLGPGTLARLDPAQPRDGFEGASLFVDHAELLSEAEQGAVAAWAQAAAGRWLVVATPEPERALHPALRACFRLQLRLPELRRRLSDLPHLARHLLDLRAVEDPRLAARFGAGGPWAFGPELVTALLCHRWALNDAELERLLLRAASTSVGPRLELTDALATDLAQPEPPDTLALDLPEDAAWFEVGSGRVDLSRRHPARRLLALLAAEAVARPGAEVAIQALIAAGWPGEVLVGRSGRMRLHTTVRSLRSQGLAEILQTTERGYRLNPAVRIRRHG